VHLHIFIYFKRFLTVPYNNYRQYTYLNSFNQNVRIKYHLNVGGYSTYHKTNVFLDRSFGNSILSRINFLDKNVTENSNT